MENCDAVLAVCLKIVFFLTKMAIFWVYNPFLDTDTHTDIYIYIIYIYLCMCFFYKYIVVCIYIYVGGGTVSMKTAEHLS